MFNQHFENNVGGGGNQGLRIAEHGLSIFHKTQLDKVEQPRQIMVKSYNFTFYLNLVILSWLVKKILFLK